VAGENLTPGTAQWASQGQAGRIGGNQRFDLDRFTQEVATEIGVDPSKLSASGLNPQQVRAYEANLHSSTQKGGSR